MARRVPGQAASLLVLALAIVSTTFVYLTLTSKNWSRQDYYAPADGNATGETVFSKSICPAPRSPFYRCGQIIVTYDSATNQTKCSLPDCKYYKPYGSGRTSCETVSTVITSTLARADECQAVHYSGNLQIAACVFITLGLIMTLPVTLLSLAPGTSPSTSAHDHTSMRIDADTAKEARDDTVTATAHHSHSSKSNHKSHRTKSAGKIYMAGFLLAFMYVGVLMQILAQYFGVLGLVTYATPTPSDVAGTAQGVTGATWKIDKGLNTYATVAWTSALATAALAGTVFKTPTFRQFAM